MDVSQHLQLEIKRIFLQEDKLMSSFVSFGNASFVEKKPTVDKTESFLMFHQNIEHSRKHSKFFFFKVF